MNTRIRWVALACLGALALTTSAVAKDFDENPTPERTPPPVYPADLERQHVDGMVLLRVSITETGAVDECEVKKSTHVGFEESAVQAVKTWKFKPAKKDGSPVKAKILLPVKFSHEG